MSEAQIIAHASNAMYLVLIISLPPIGVAATVGILLALIQALTQIQEQTLQFVVKLVAVSLMLWGMFSWMGAELLGYAAQSFENIANVHPPRGK